MPQINLPKKSKLKLLFLSFAICFVPFCGTNAQDACDDSCNNCLAEGNCSGECATCGSMGEQ